MLRKKEEKLRNIYRTIEKSNYIKEKKKSDWLDKQFQREDKMRQIESQNSELQFKRIEELKRKEFYRDEVKKRQHDNEEFFKHKTIQVLEKKQGR